MSRVLGMVLLWALLCVLPTTASSSPQSVNESRGQPTEATARDQANEDSRGDKLPGTAPDFRASPGQPTHATATLRTSKFKKALSDWLTSFVPNQGGVLWLAVVVTTVVAFNFRKLLSWRNADLVLLFLPAIVLVDIVRFSKATSDPVKFALAGMVFLALFLLTAAIFVRAVVGGVRCRTGSWVPNLPPSVLRTLFIVLLACNLLLLFGHMPDDCGLYTNLGARQMRETGKFPYGDPNLRGGAAATYGPLLYVAHMPFQLAVKGFAVDRVRDGLAWPPVIATQLTLLLFHAIGIVALVIIGRKLSGPPTGWALACLYIGSAYVMGLGGDVYFIGGLPYISHIAPAAVTLAAFAALQHPFWSGTLLAAAAGVLFYPAFMFPLWFGYYFWRRKGWAQFAAGFVGLSMAIGLSVLAMTETRPGESVIAVLHESTVGHQEAATMYGSSSFGFWGTHPKAAAFWQQPLHPSWYLLKPAFLLFLAFLAATFFLAHNRTVPQLAFLTAAVCSGVQLWKSHAGGTYVEWYLPFLLIGLFASEREASMGTRELRELDPAAATESAEVMVHQVGG